MVWRSQWVVMHGMATQEVGTTEAGSVDRSADHGDLETVTGCPAQGLNGVLIGHHPQVSILPIP